MNRIRSILLRNSIVGFMLALVGVSQAQELDLDEFSLEDLVNMRVTLVSRKEEDLVKAPAAAFILTNEDIRRSGATSIADALRLVPGLQVARIDGNKWAITSRGFNDRYANKLLVLIDGRSVYTPLFSGVIWEAQDVLLEDVDRIEVIRGPGATLWGANAVNGIINIVTSKAEVTQGLLVATGTGTEERGWAHLRYGSQLGEDAHFRIYGKYFDRDALKDSQGRDSRDGWSALRGGFRLDWLGGDVDEFTLQGDLYDGDLNQRLGGTGIDVGGGGDLGAKALMSGANILGRWDRNLSPTSVLTVQSYLDRTRREDQMLVAETRHTFDLDVQHRFERKRQDLVWGFGFRITEDDIEEFGESLSFDPPQRTLHLLSAFVQDEIALSPERVKLILGTKVEHNSYTGLEIQPNARAAWYLGQQTTGWVAISRAVRNPSRSDRDLRVVSDELALGGFTFGDQETTAILSGNGNYQSEKVWATELGLRHSPLQTLSLDLALFYNRYDDLNTIELNLPYVDPDGSGLIVPLQLDNKRHGTILGGESIVDWRLSPRWRLQAAYSYLQAAMKNDADSQDVGSSGTLGGLPSHQVWLRSGCDLGRGIRFDITARFVDELKGVDIDSYAEADLRLGWHFNDETELVFAGQNLLHGRHAEFSSDFATGQAELERGLYVGLLWRGE